MLYDGLTKLKWDKRYMTIAKAVGRWSKDPRKKVGCVIAGTDHEILSTGYNGFARGIADTPDRYNDRVMKRALVVHAEINAICNATRTGAKLVGSMLYVSGLPPCTNCANAIIQCGIKRVVFECAEVPDHYVTNCAMAADLLEEAHVLLLRLVR